MTASVVKKTRSPMVVQAKSSSPVKDLVISHQFTASPAKTADPSNKFRNIELENATSRIQEEFDRILNSGVGNRSPISPKGQSVNEELKMDEFYKVMGEFYSGDMKRHKSPTKRLIAQKNSTAQHKTVMRGMHTQNYSLHYTSSPGKSYIIEPKGGELDYDLARKNPLEFYNSVIEQKVS